MKLFVSVCLLALSGCIKADGVDVYAPGHASLDYYAYPKYAFEYSVKDPHTGDNKAQWEKREGDVVKGAYSLVEPDGSLRVVDYWADDKSGFNAVVKRIGPNVHSTVHSVPIYKADIPILPHEPIAPLIGASVGPVAGWEKLAHAPLLSGHAISSQSLIKNEMPVKNIMPLPVIAPAPILKNSYLEPYPMYKAPIPAPWYGPAIKAPLAPMNSWGWDNSRSYEPYRAWESPRSWESARSWESPRSWESSWSKPVYL